MMSGKSSRDAGRRFEYKIRDDFIKMGWNDCIRSAGESRNRDNQLVDLMFTDPFNIQCKRTVNGTCDFWNIIPNMPDETNYNLVFNYRGRGKEYVMLSDDDFWELRHMTDKFKLPVIEKQSNRFMYWQEADKGVVISVRKEGRFAVMNKKHFYKLLKKLIKGNIICPKKKSTQSQTKRAILPD